jgi:bacterioferritin-associated ferredoxin
MVAMIVCSCHVISDTDLRDALVASERPVRHLRDIYAQAGVTPQCGRCAPTMRHVASMAGAEHVPDPH